SRACSTVAAGTVRRPLADGRADGLRAGRAGSAARPLLDATGTGWTAGTSTVRSASAIRPANSTRHTDATTISPSTDNGSRYGDAPVSPYLAATPTMCQYDTHAAMPAISAVAASRTAARARRWTGTREMSSTVSSSATGGHAAIVWLIGLGWACRTLAVTGGATPRARTARTAQRTRTRRRTVTFIPPDSPVRSARRSRRATASRRSAGMAG